MITLGLGPCILTLCLPRFRLEVIGMGVIIEFPELQTRQEMLVYAGGLYWQERKADGSTLVCYAINAYEQELERLGIDTSEFPLCHEQLLADRHYHLPDNAKQEVLSLSRQQRARIVICMIRAMQEMQIKENADKVSIEFRGHEFLFLPLELRGRWQFSRDLRAIEHALPRFGLINANDCCVFIEQEFMQMQLAYLRRNDINSLASLTSYLVHLGDYHPEMPSEIICALKNRGFAIKVALQAIDYNQDFFQERVWEQSCFLQKAEA